ncbi:MAG: sodium:calcium antiporter, partial [Gammaproteobacteria bacterium]
KKPGMAVGNVVGSNIFNIFFTLGVSSVIYPLPLNMSLNLAVLVTVAGSLLLLVFASSGRQGNLGRIKGIFLFLSYIGYTTYLIGTA